LKLNDLGFSRDIITETIVTTYNFDNTPNAAPMGTTLLNSQMLILRPYVVSNTFANLKARGVAVINVTEDPWLYYSTAFKEEACGKLHGTFRKASVVNAPVIKSADAWVEVVVGRIVTPAADRAEVTCKALRIHARKKVPQAYCRAVGATIEAIVHATRVKAYLEKGADEEVSKLMEKIKYNRDVVNHVAANSQYAHIMKNLARLIELWRKNRESLC
jgi:hypothetical protein